MGVGATVDRKTNNDQTLSSPCISSSSSSSSLSNNNGGQNEIDESHTSTAFSADSVFGSVPNQLEVNYAITAFQSFMMQGLSSSMLKSDGIQPRLNPKDATRKQHSTGFQRVYDAFLLLQTLPSVRRMVVSISCDAAVWDAIMRNNEVQEFRKSLQQVAEARRLQRSGGELETDFVAMALKWILDKMKLQIMEIIKNLKSVLLVVNNNNNSSTNENMNNNTEAKQEEFEETILLTVLMSTITLMIVLVTRAS